MAKQKIENIIRFKIIKTPNCWEWGGSKNNAGIGFFYYEGQIKYPHRISWEMKHNKSSKYLIIIQDCKNKLCCNPDHLIAKGTNDRDRMTA